VLSIADLTKAYGDQPVLCGVDLEIAPGEILALLGPNGAGKTTLVSIVAGLRRADGGTVRVGGVDALRHPRRARSLLGLAPQQLGIYPSLTARASLEFVGQLYGLRGRRLTQRIGEVAEALDLADLLERRAGVLSGGQQRRLHTAMALLHRPRLLFLDEPTVGADVESRQRLLAVVRGLADDGCAVCYATHYLSEVEELDAVVAVLEGGRIIAREPVGRLIQQHGEALLRLVFSGDSAPPLPGFRIEGRAAVRRVPDPGRDVAGALAGLGPAAARLEAVELVRPSLEAAYLALTGRRTAEAGGGAAESGGGAAESGGGAAVSGAETARQEVGHVG
jgi:ABC-2 type transport system ATP-binding protein